MGSTSESVKIYRRAGGLVRKMFLCGARELV